MPEAHGYGGRSLLVFFSWSTHHITKNRGMSICLLIPLLKYDITENPDQATTSLISVFSYHLSAKLSHHTQSSQAILSPCCPLFNIVIITSTTFGRPFNSPDPPPPSSPWCSPSTAPECLLYSILPRQLATSRNYRHPHPAPGVSPYLSIKCNPLAVSTIPEISPG